MPVKRHPTRSPNPFTSDELTKLTRAVRRTSACISGPNSEENSAIVPAFPMDLLPHSVFGFEPSGIMVAANIHAKQMLNHGDAVKLDRGNVLELSNGAMLSLRNGSFLLARKNGCPLEGNARHSTDGIVVELRDPDDAEELEPRILSVLHHLTPSEAQIARLLHRGLEPNLVANALGVRITTIRSHIQSILQKLEARDLIDLSRRLELSLARAIGALPTDRARRLP